MTLPSKTLAALAAATAAMAFSSPAAAACLRGPFKVNLPAQRLDQRLQTIKAKTGCPVQIKADLLAGRKAPAISGNLSAEEMIRYSTNDAGFTLTRQQGSFRLDLDDGSTPEDQ